MGVGEEAVQISGELGVPGKLRVVHRLLHFVLFPYFKISPFCLASVDREFYYTVSDCFYQGQL